MTYKTLDNLTMNGSSSDLTNILSLPGDGISFAWSLILFAILIIFSLRLFFKEYELKGRADFMASLVPASFVTVLIATILNLMNLITSGTLIIWIVIFVVISAIFLLTSSKQ